ncbi:DUF1700 domain-containing protein [Mollicutes bacterium LVI A0039]|nr:DUF1700 domain-containing protein [Mollicutes bacterium LVI A0039]
MKDKCREFLKELEIELQHLPQSEITKVINYYEESIEDRLEDEMSDDDIVNSFGPIDQIVATIEEEISLGTIVKDKVSQKASGKKINYVLLALVLILGFPIWFTLMMLMLAVLITVYALLWTIPVMVVAIYAALLVTAVVSAGAVVYSLTSVSIFTTMGLMGLSLVSSGIAIVLFKPLIWAGKKWIQINLWPFKKIKQILIRK